MSAESKISDRINNVEKATENIDSRVKKLEESVGNLNDTLKTAKIWAAVFRISTGTLWGWAIWEGTRLYQIDRFVTTAKGQIEATGNQQIELIKAKAVPVVDELTKQKFATMNANDVQSSLGTKTILNPGSDHSEGNDEVDCLAGEYLAGMKLEWSGTCKGQCGTDGHQIRSIRAVCRKLVPQ